ncbi:MAG TPA: hypothetical protein PKH93_05415, partial [Chitinophagales bacterium]|nr:hypothetical protein [Chitinophagales bacterium]
MNKNLLFFTSLCLILFSISLPLSAQTVLSQGDIAVIGVNANNGACSGTSTEDKISFVCFKPITTGTQICVTDCAYVSASNTWGENEGLVCMTYTGATLAAGTIITFSSSGIAPVSSPNNPYAGTYPSSSMPYSVAPGTWSLACPNPPFVSGSAFNIAMNMNSGGDQIYFLQGGTWTNPAGANNATYPNSNVLYGFSSSSAGFTTASLSTPPATGTTNLVPGMECNVMAPSTSTDFSYFVPPSPAPTSQAGWIAAINNSANWFPGISCSDYNTTFATQYPAGTLFTGSLPSGRARG